MARPMEHPRRQPPPKKANPYLDLNTDFGQSADRSFFEGKEKTLLHYVSSVNIPCCVHDSDPRQVLLDIETAKKNNCVVGAHFAYPDPQHFGYEVMDLSPEELTAWILLQLGSFSALCQANDIAFEHVRPHGALYTRFLEDEATAITIAKAVKRFDPWMILIAPMGPLARKVQEIVDIQISEEVYLGKRVSAEGVLLLDRFQENLHPQGVIEQVKQLVSDSSITTEDGTVIKVSCKTMHLSPKLQGNMMIGERINAILGQPTPLVLSSASNSGWV